jgi:hypothetical protein
MRVAQICLLSVLLCAVFQLSRTSISHADTVHLKNGKVIHGQAQDLRSEGGPVRVEFAGKGFMILRAEEVAKVEENDLDAFALWGEEARPVPAADAKPVLVTLKRGNNYYGAGSYFGWPASADDEPILLLKLPGGGTLRVPRQDIDTIETVEPDKVAAPAVEPAEGLLRTTHVVYLKNGRKIRGDLVETKDSEPLKLAVGNLGTLSFPRDKVEKIEKEDGTYKLPEPAPAQVEEVQKPTPEELREQLKEELRREIIRELLDSLMEKKIDQRIDSVLEQEELGMIEPATVGAEELMDIQFQVRELGRQRTINRTRAEAALKRMGSAVIPFLNSAAAHPFELTRRAVQRIIRDVGDMRGAPLAIRGLDDPDLFVRRLAHQALQKLLGIKISFNPEGSEESRLAAQRRYREAWEEVRRAELREAVDERAE